jgi:hypothetical protein
MICRYCCRGYIADGFDVRPCPECGGSGIVHCCEGERPDQCPVSIGRTDDANSLSHLSDAELIAQLSDTAKQLGVEINLNYSFLQQQKPDDEPQD